jgi:hypothetical protein
VRAKEEEHKAAVAATVKTKETRLMAVLQATVQTKDAEGAAAVQAAQQNFELELETRRAKSENDMATQLQELQVHILLRATFASDRCRGGCSAAVERALLWGAWGAYCKPCDTDCAQLPTRTKRNARRAVFLTVMIPAGASGVEGEGEAGGAEDGGLPHGKVILFQGTTS